MTETTIKKTDIAEHSVKIECSSALNGPKVQILPDEKVWNHDHDLQKAGKDHILKVS